ncbi:MAG: hypothetical protein IT361_00335 [Gemmatimonadaceae bacterium]|nr:hypothetical protein [Gemmatimonadaceae bacterium]
MRINLIAPLALFAALILSACADSPVSPLTDDVTAAASKGSDNSGSATSAGRIRVFAQLTAPTSAPYVSARGKAKWDSRNNNTKREFEIEAEHLPAGLVVEFYLAGASLGKATTNTFGKAQLNFSTQLGQPVPISVSGATAEVKTAAGVVIVRGAFAR